MLSWRDVAEVAQRLDRQQAESEHVLRVRDSVIQICNTYGLVAALLMTLSFDAFINPPSHDDSQERAWLTQGYAYGVSLCLCIFLLIFSILFSIQLYALVHPDDIVEFLKTFGWYRTLLFGNFLATLFLLLGGVLASAKINYGRAGISAFGAITAVGFLSLALFTAWLISSVAKITARRKELARQSNKDAVADNSSPTVLKNNFVSNS